MLGPRGVRRFHLATVQTAEVFFVAEHQRFDDGIAVEIMLMRLVALTMSDQRKCSRNCQRAEDYNQEIGNLQLKVK
jgi:hypothetical protein